jgi:prepilin-type N-terminal cleavage/methylation domain-containing protein
MRTTLLHAFTLIELLIVVAIIAILAAIAVPNFLEAQTRAKTARAVSDMRTYATAMESYRVDNSQYPVLPAGDQLTHQSKLTTPIAYITSILFDPFRDRRQDPGFGSSTFYIYHNFYPPPARTLVVGGGTLDHVYIRRIAARGAVWHIYSVGPDGDHRNGFPNNSSVREYLAYDPSNGSVSPGNINRWGPGNVTGGY